MYVDPHVRRIWETVAEKRPVPSETVMTTEIETEREIEGETMTAAAVLVEEATPSEETVPEKTSTPILTTTKPPVDVAREEAPIVPPAPVEEPPAVPPSTHVEGDSPVTLQAPLEEPATQSLLSTPVVPASDASPIPATEHESESAESVVAQSLHPGSVGVAAGSTAGAVEDVEDFLRDIGIGTEGEEEVKVDSREELQEREEAGEEAKAEEEQGKQHPAAPVRADILARHDKWERDLQDIVQSVEEEVRHVLGQIRAAAVVELGQYETKGKKHEKRGVVGVMEEEAERFVMGLEGYLRGAEARVGMEKEGEVGREEKTWYRVLEKTEEKFSKKIEEVQAEVYGWYVKVREQEGEEVEKAVGFFLSLFVAGLTVGSVDRESEGVCADCTGRSCVRLCVASGRDVSRLAEVPRSHPRCVFSSLFWSRFE